MRPWWKCCRGVNFAGSAAGARELAVRSLRSGAAQGGWLQSSRVKLWWIPDTDPGYVVRRSIPTFITTLNASGDRIYVGDNQHSFHYVKYRAAENQMYAFADDTTPRWLTAAQPLDYNTIAGADKFGNIVVRARSPAIWCCQP